MALPFECMYSCIVCPMSFEIPYLKTLNENEKKLRKKK
jgi:hypothetical protein